MFCILYYPEYSVDNRTNQSMPCNIYEYNQTSIPCHTKQKTSSPYNNVIAPYSLIERHNRIAYKQD
ncbi:hypothetical protein BLOT_000198 [Blomia tropicalis]|nr:hypothetical protein BLOT_000198 [Blomia tropicalis]